MPLQQTSGNATVDAYGGGVAVVPNYIEDVFSTYLYTGNSSTQTITNGIDLAGKGGMVWIKNRLATESVAWNHILTDTNRGRQYNLFSNLTDAQSSSGSFGITSFDANGFSVDGGGGSSPSSGASNVNFSSAANYASWTFRKQPKFFDVVTYTGTGSNTTIPHNLGSAPGCIIVKRTDTTSNWAVWHRSSDAGSGSASSYIYLNLTNAVAEPVPATAFWNSTVPTSTVFSLGTSSSVNASGGTYVAYLFAHNAGGFGATGTDNVVSCGSFVGDGSNNAYVNLGYEPQWVMLKRTDGVGNWYMVDTMRGFTSNVGGASPLYANLSNAESVNATTINPTSTGFYMNVGAGAAFIYIAIRRGPMKVPTDGTKVFLPTTFVGSNTVNKVVNTNFTVDMTWGRTRDAANSMEDYDRLRGNTVRLSTDLTDAEISATALYFDVSNGVSLRAGYDLNFSTYNFINYNFARAPGFFDEVCYTGTGVDLTLSHNLQAVPQMIICKSRSGTDDWSVYQQYSYNGFYGGIDLALPLNGTTIYSTPGFWKATPTSSVFYLPSDTYTTVNAPGQTYVAYLFATCPGVSKVGSYTGTGATQTINCGFAAGARLVLIRRTNSPGGDWYVWDTARGMVSGTDPSLLLNSTAAEVNANSIYTATTGFQIVSTAAGINASGGSYIFLAIA